MTIALAAALAGPSAQQQDRAGQSTIRTGITLVPFDVRVVDRNGRPVTDLKQSEFTVLEDGVRQTIGLFSAYSFTPERPAAAPRPLKRVPSSAGLASQNRRVFLIVLGRGYHQSAAKYVDALARFVDTGMLPQDHVAVLAWNRIIGFTTDHERVKRLIIHFRDRHGRIETELREWFSGLRAVYGSKEIPVHIQRAIDAVFVESGFDPNTPIPNMPATDERQIASDTRRISGELLRNQEITEKRDAGGTSLPDLVAESTAAMTDLQFDEYFAKMTGTMQDLGSLYAGIGYLRHFEGEKHLVWLTENGLSLPSMESARTLGQFASDARIALDLIQTGGVVGAPPPRMLRGGGIKTEPWATSNQVFAQTFAMQELRLVTDITGGQLQAFAPADRAFDRLADATRFQYLLGYYPADSKWNGKYRQVAISVSRPGVRVMHRQGYFASERPIPLDSRDLVISARIQAAGRHSGIINDLKVSAGTPTVSGAGAARQLSLDVRVDISRVRFIREQDRDVAALEVAVFCGDAKQQVVGEARQRVDLKLTEALRAEMSKTGLVFRLTAPLTGDPRVVKVIVYDFAADLVGTATTKVVQ